MLAGRGKRADLAGRVKSARAIQRYRALVPVPDIEENPALPPSPRPVDHGVDQAPAQPASAPAGIDPHRIKPGELALGCSDDQPDVAHGRRDSHHGDGLRMAEALSPIRLRKLSFTLKCGAEGIRALGERSQPDRPCSLPRR